jgi:hypothetical protein
MGLYLQVKHYLAVCWLFGSVLGASQKRGRVMDGVVIRNSFAVTLAVLTLAVCTEAFAQSAAERTAEFRNCIKSVRETLEGRVVYARLWTGEETTAEKLNDPNPLTKPERDALVAVHKALERCRQIIVTHANPQELAVFEEYFQRSDAIFYKLASGEIAVGEANRLRIESEAKRRADGARAVSAESLQAAQTQGPQAASQAQAQAAASKALLHAGAQLLTAGPHVTTTNCSWLGNMISCTGVR